jgi:N-acetylglucosamine-6-phosphate deacetylase
MNRQVEGNIPGEGYARIEIDGERITSVDCIGAERPSAAFVSPGFVDIQLNGFSGVNFSNPTLRPEELIGVLASLWKTGTTTFCPTLITNSHDGLLNNIKVLEEARRSDSDFASAVPCYHLEGPYLSPFESRGAHDPKLMRPPDWDEFLRLQEAAGGRIGIMTLAPELPGALEFIRKAAAANVVVAISHTDAKPEQIHQAADAGAKLSTHWGNGCPQFLHRHNNPLWAQLAIESLTVSLICDGFHLPPDVVKVAARVKGIDKCILTTDATHVANMPPGRYSIVGTEIDLLPSGQVVTADGRCMAGSSVTMDRAVSMFVQYAEVPLNHAIQAAACNPARLIGREGICSRIAKHEPANLVLFGYDGHALEVETVLFRGRTVYSRNDGTMRKGADDLGQTRSSIFKSS